MVLLQQSGMASSFPTPCSAERQLEGLAWVIDDLSGASTTGQDAIPR
jgi:hypothetical protein